MDMNGLVNPPVASANPPSAPGNGGVPSGANSSPLQALLSQQQQQPPPPPTREQIIATIKHFQAVKKQFMPIAMNTGLGKENLRPKIFDATATLLGQGIFTLPQAINGTKDLPADPPGQKKWVLQHLQNIQQAELMILDHYSSGPPEIPQMPGQQPMQQPGEPNIAPGARLHSDIMSEIARNYKGG